MISAMIRPGRPEDLPEVRQLLSNGLRSYLNAGVDVLPELLQGATAAAVHAHTQRILGFISLQQEECSDALPAQAPVRVSVRAAAASSPGSTARAQFKALFECAAQALPAHPSGHLFYVLTDQGWLQASLRETGFVLHDAILFYESRASAAHPVPQPANLRPAQRSDLPRLACVDAAAFDPLWHMGKTELGRLYCEGRMEVAVSNEKAVGYSALNLHTDGTGHRKGSAQLVRLAVHPQAQDLGIGRQLLVSSLCHAHSQGIRHVFLNTQESNSLSQVLYESLQFRKLGRKVPVFVRRVPNGLE
jgi:ribosomal protein S18 acetylase RimI-like enzyme